ncbi:hypothetical protein LXL04_033235 [Taraxacum kok-saghyz]
MGIPVPQWGWGWSRIFITRWVWGRVWGCDRVSGMGMGIVIPGIPVPLSKLPKTAKNNHKLFFKRSSPKTLRPLVPAGGYRPGPRCQGLPPPNPCIVKLVRVESNVTGKVATQRADSLLYRIRQFLRNSSKYRRCHFTFYLFHLLSIPFPLASSFPRQMRKVAKPDITWEHCSRVDPTNRNKVKCNYYQKIMFRGVNRMKHYLGGTKKDIADCTVVDETIKQLFLGLLMGFEEKKKTKAKDDECFEVVSDEENTQLDGTLNPFVKKRTQTTMNQTVKNREPIIRGLCQLLYGEALSFNLVKSPLWKRALKLVGEYGKGFKTSLLSRDAKKLLEMLDALVEEVGEENVVQAVTDSASAYVLAGTMLENKRPRLFWSHSVAHLIDLMLQDIGEGPSFKDTIEKSKKRVTRFSTSFLTLKRFQELKIPIRELFASKEWAECNFASTNDGKLVENIIPAYVNFWKAVKYCLSCVVPVYKILRLMDGDVNPAMGNIYEAMDRAKEQKKENFNGLETRYKPIWKKIDTRWDMQLHRPLLHATGYYLNPRSIAMRKKTQPVKWWLSYGDECPELQHLVVCVLSLTCSATGCERNWSTFDHVHSKKRNRLEQQRLNALVFVKYNLNLNMRLEKRRERGETYDPICLSDMDSDDEWITEKEDACLLEDNSWMDVHECFRENEGTSRSKRKRGPRNLNKVPVTNEKGKTTLVDMDTDDDFDVEDVDEARLHGTTIILEGEEVNVEETEGCGCPIPAANPMWKASPAANTAPDPKNCRRQWFSGTSLPMENVTVA